LGELTTLCQTPESDKEETLLPRSFLLSPRDPRAPRSPSELYTHFLDQSYPLVSASNKRDFVIWISASCGANLFATDIKLLRYVALRFMYGPALRGRAACIWDASQCDQWMALF